MAKYKKKKGVDPKLSAYFSKNGSKGGKTKSLADRIARRKSLAQVRDKRWPK